MPEIRRQKSKIKNHLLILHGYTKKTTTQTQIMKIGISNQLSMSHSTKKIYLKSFHKRIAFFGGIIRIYRGELSEWTEQPNQYHD